MAVNYLFYLFLTEKAATDAQNEVNKAIEMRKKILETGALVYNCDSKTAEQFWKVN
jgi:hypothetical protein